MHKWMAAAFLILALAGCSADPDVSKDGSHTHGEIVTCSDGTRLDPADFGDHHDTDFDLASKCPTSGTPGFVGVRELAAATAYDAITITWDVVPGDGGDHAMHTGVKWSQEAGAPGEGPDSWGSLVEEHSHQPAPAPFEATFVPQTPGDYVLRAFAQTSTNGPYVWSEPVTLAVAEIPASGVEEAIHIEFGLPTPSLSDASVQITAGDAVVFINDDIREHTLTSTGGPQEFDTGALAASGGTSEAFVLLRIGNYDVTNADGTVTGRINVLAP